jgi:hypothetical protein
MESGIQSSFIPQEADVVVTPGSANRYVGGDGLTDLFGLFSIVLFIASLSLGAGVFLYQQFLTAQTSSKIEQLARAKAAFDPALIQRLIRLDDRMRAAEQLLNDHIAPSVVFDALNQSTLATVSFRSFEIDAADPKNIVASFTGTAQSVNSIALQDQVFSKNGVVAAPIFSDIERQQGGVNFALKTSINYNALNYSKVVVPGSTAEQTPPMPSGPVSPFNKQ